MCIWDLVLFASLMTMKINKFEDTEQMGDVELVARKRDICMEDG